MSNRRQNTKIKEMGKAGPRPCASSHPRKPRQAVNLVDDVLTLLVNGGLLTLLTLMLVNFAGYDCRWLIVVNTSSCLLLVKIGVGEVTVAMVK